MRKVCKVPIYANEAKFWPMQYGQYGLSSRKRPPPVRDHLGLTSSVMNNFCPFLPDQTGHQNVKGYGLVVKNKDS